MGLNDNENTSVVLYIHGVNGNVSEADHFKEFFPHCDVIAIDYKSIMPWETGREIKEKVNELKEKYKKVILIANSIGAYFAMDAEITEDIRRAYFISPIVDMEALILDLMSSANVSESDLKEAGTIKTDSGYELSWEYLSYVRSRELSWRVPTEVLYGSEDKFTSFDSIKRFAVNHGCSLTVMKDGEHWFHTEEQMQFLDGWIRKFY